MIFIFKKHRSIYLVPAESEDNAWELLARKQTMSIKTCQKQYSYLDSVTEFSEIKKIKL